MDFNTKLKKYAELAVKTGVNIQPGQTLLVRTPIECAEYVRYVVEEAYKAGAKNVHIEWSDEKCNLYLNAPDEAFEEFPRWISDQYLDIAKEGGAFLTIYAQDPDLLKNVDPKRIAEYQKVSGQALKEWRGYTLTNKCRWSIVSIPTAAWAKKIFPDVSEQEAMDKLWDLIFKCSRVTDDPIQAWKEHNNNLKEKTDFLNSKKFKTLKYKSKITDLTVEMPKGHIWESGSEKDVNGIELREVIVGGTGSDSLNLYMPENSPEKYESSSQNIVAIAGLNAALDLLDKNGVHYKKEKELTDYLVDNLSNVEGVKLYIPSDREKHVSIVSFNVDGYKADDVGNILDEEFNIEVRTGYHCAPFIHKHLNDIDSLGTVRVGIGIFNSKEDIDKLVECITEITEY